MVASEHKPFVDDPTQQAEIVQKSPKFVEALQEVHKLDLKYLIETSRPG